MIKTWNERCEDHPDHNGIVTERMIQARMQEEIDELRAALESRQWQGLTDDDIAQAMYRVDAIITGPMQFNFARAIEAKLREKNT